MERKPYSQFKRERGYYSPPDTTKKETDNQPPVAAKKDRGYYSEVADNQPPITTKKERGSYPEAIDAADSQPLVSNEMEHEPQSANSAIDKEEALPTPVSDAEYPTIFKDDDEYAHAMDRFFDGFENEAEAAPRVPLKERLKERMPKKTKTRFNRTNDEVYAADPSANTDDVPETKDTYADYDYDDQYANQYDDQYADSYYSDEYYDDTRKSRWWIAPLVVLIVLAIIGIVCFALFSAYNKALDPIDPKDTSQVEFVVESGATTDSIATKLEKNGLTRKAFYFKVHSKLAGNDGRYRQGTYVLSKAMSMDTIMETMISGKKNKNVLSFTIPEGLTTKQTMDVLVKAGFVTEEDFMKEVKSGKFDYKFLEGAPKGETRLEGFLCPNTYETFKNATAHDIIDKMLKQFDATCTQEFYDRAKAEGRSIYDAVIVASMIERETAVPDERPMIASVIYNRMKKDMKLQIDATVQYALPKVKKYLSYEDLKVDSPYNTYLHDGLPPTPICSPRTESIKAALWPGDTQYLYYVMKPEMDGSHNFAETESQFEKYRQEYYDANGLS